MVSNWTAFFITLLLQDPHLIFYFICLKVGSNWEWQCRRTQTKCSGPRSCHLWGKCQLCFDPIFFSMLVPVVCETNMCCYHSLTVLWSSATTMTYSWLCEHMSVWWMALSVSLKVTWSLSSRQQTTAVRTCYSCMLSSHHLSQLYWPHFSYGTCTGTANNAGAILVLGRDLVVVPKLIHPLPPAMSPETSPEHIEDTWMQVCGIIERSRCICIRPYHNAACPVLTLAC